VLSYAGPVTFRRSVDAWRDTGLLRSAAQSILFLNDVRGGEDDAFDCWRRRTAREAGFDVVLEAQNAHRNVGFGGFTEMLRACRHEFFLFLEEDFTVARSASRAVDEQLRSAMDLLATGVVRAVKLRHLREGGSPNWALQTWNDNPKNDVLSDVPRAEWGRGKSYADFPAPDVFVLKWPKSDEDPSKDPALADVPCQVWRCREKPANWCVRSASHDRWYPLEVRTGGDPATGDPTTGDPTRGAAATPPRATVAEAKYAPYTNNPTMYETAWALHNLAPIIDALPPERHMEELEAAVLRSPLWSEAPGVIYARPEGLFRHARWDRGRDVGALGPNDAAAMACARGARDPA
jgi:hypothetical protein